MKTHTTHPHWTAAPLHHALAALLPSLRRATPKSAAPPHAPALTAPQQTAVQRARSALARFGGALIADPPGTGKSFIGLHLALDAARRDETILLTAPAAIIPTWKQLCRSARLDCHFASHTRLSLDDHTLASIPAPAFILVDEAHAFRSPNTRRYHTLARLARNAHVLLLTATPINNSLMDLYFQLRLFLSDDALHHLGVSSLHTAFTTAASSPRSPLPRLLADALDHVVIRRSLNDLQIVGMIGDRPPGTADSPPGTAPTSPASPPTPALPPTLPCSFPTLRQPDLVRYALPHDFQRQALHSLSSISLAAFDHTPTGRAPAELLRLTLAKRLESGLAPFAASIRALLSFHTAFLDALRSGYLLRPRDLTASSDRAEQLVFSPLVGRPIPTTTNPAALERLVRHDTATLHDLLLATRNLLPHDPKRAALLHQLEGPLHDRHILLFTEFRETAADLWAALRHLPGTARLDGSGAFLASGRCSRTEVIRRFAPTANNAPPPPHHQRICLLIATDILSEGVNLQDADTLIAYDLPWNPVRLIQRIGRIARLGSQHPEVQAIIFLPDLWLDEFLDLVDRVDAKLQAIRTGLDDPAHTSSPADRYTAFVRALHNGASPLHAATTLPTKTPPPHPLTPLLDIRNRNRIRTRHSAEPALTPNEPAVPTRNRIRIRTRDDADDAPTPVATLYSTSTRHAAILLALDSPDGPRLTLCRRRTARPFTRSGSTLLLRALDSELTSPPEQLTGATRSALDRAASLATRQAERRTASPTGTTTRAIRRTLRIAAAHPDDPALAATADRIVSRITHGLRAGDLITLRDFCRQPLHSTTLDPAATLHTLESALSSARATTAAREHRILAAFVLLPAAQR